MKYSSPFNLLIFLLLLAGFIAGCVRVKVETPYGDQIGMPPIECSVPSFEEQSEVIHTMDITRHPLVTNFSAEKAENIIAQASNVARMGGGKDFACKIDLKWVPTTGEKPKGINQVPAFTIAAGPQPVSPVSPDDGLHNGEILTEFDFNTVVNAEPRGGVKIVKLIKWCGIPATGVGMIGGCSWKNNSIVISKCQGLPCPIHEGVMWLHEFGHLQGLDHRSPYDTEPGVMKPAVRRHHTFLNKCECQKFRR